MNQQFAEYAPLILEVMRERIHAKRSRLNTPSIFKNNWKLSSNCGGRNAIQLRQNKAK